MKTGKTLFYQPFSVSSVIQYLTHYPSLNFNIVCKRLGAHRMSYYLNEAASELRDLLMPDLAAQSEKAKL